MAYSEGGYRYTRSGNLMRAALEERLSSLERSTDALATADGAYRSENPTEATRLIVAY